MDLECILNSLSGNNTIFHLLNPCIVDPWQEIQTVKVAITDSHDVWEVVEASRDKLNVVIAK